MFEYVKGDIKTNVVFTVTKKEELIDFVKRNDWFFKKYKCYIHGAFLGGLRTYDVDFYVVSEPSKELGEDCIRICNIALEETILIDFCIMRPEYFGFYYDLVKEFNSGNLDAFGNLLESEKQWYKPHNDCFMNGERVDRKDQYYEKQCENIWRRRTIDDDKKSWLVDEKLMKRKIIYQPVLLGEYLNG